MNLKIYPKNPAPKHIEQLKEALNNGGLVIIPTDSVYAIACASNQPTAIKKLTELKGSNEEKTNLSFLFSELSMVSDFTKSIRKDHYKLINRVLPGPFTFILHANGLVDKIFPGRKTIGVRVPDNNIVLQLIKELGVPLVTTSLHDDDEILEYTTNPEVIIKKWESKVDVIVDGGYGNNEATTVLDCTEEVITMIRKGIGEIDEVLI